MAYGKLQKFQGPFPTSYNLMAFNYTLGIQFDNGRTPLQVKNNNGFEVTSHHDISYSITKLLMAEYPFLTLHL